MLLITGTGRSGTSFVAKWFYDMGKIDYDYIWLNEYSAGLEPSDVTRINGAIFIGNDKKYQTEKEISDAIKKINYRVIKDPLFFYPNVLEYWAKRKKNLSILICLRNFEDVYKSRKLKKMNNTHSPKILTKYNKEFRHTISKYEIKHQSILFPYFLDNYDEFYTKINLLDSTLDLDYKKGKEKFNLLVNKDLINFK